jgi:hypothetical protein
MRTDTTDTDNGVPKPRTRPSSYQDDVEPTPAPSNATPATLGSLRRARWSVAISVVIALIAVALAAWALLHPLHTSTAAPATDEQISAAKARACTDVDTVRKAVTLQTHASAGNDPVAVQATAANARLALDAGGTYLLGRLDPATPPPLAAAIRTFADNLQEIAMNTLAGAGNDDPAQASRLRDGETSSGQIDDLCK